MPVVSMYTVHSTTRARAHLQLYLLWHGICKLLCCGWAKKPIDPVKDSHRCLITGLPTVHPGNKYGRTWRIIIALVDGIYTAFGVPIYAAYAGQFHFQHWYIAVSVTAGRCNNVRLFMMRVCVCVGWAVACCLILVHGGFSPLVFFPP